MELLGILSLLGGACFGQLNTATISGQVTDPEGACGGQQRQSSGTAESAAKDKRAARILAKLLFASGGAMILNK
jgi:hypothetical protein